MLSCFEGEGRPRHFLLVTRGVVSRFERKPDGSKVYYDVSVLIDAAANDLAWFAELRREQSSFSFGLNRIRNPETIVALEQFATDRGLHKKGFTKLCASTLRHSSKLATYADGEPHTIGTGGTSWARFAEMLSSTRPGQTVPVLFAPAEDFAEITGCADLIDVKTAKKDTVNEITFAKFRFLTPPLAKAAVKRENGKSLATEQYAYAICRTPTDLAKRLIPASSSEMEDLAKIEVDPTIKETERLELIQARRGQGKFRDDLDRRWSGACAVTGCSIRELLRASHIKRWSKSDNAERLNPANGLLLSANIDILFEEGYISFDDDGRMLVSSRLSYSLPGNLKKKLKPEEAHFLAYHRATFGFSV
jgi:HNH endonuclease